MPIHIRAQCGDVAPLVLLVGDPDRAVWIAEQYLEKARQVTTYRRMYGFHGQFNGADVGVFTTGMGGPSTAIVVEELIELGAQFFIRVGTCGALQPQLRAGDVICATAVSGCDAVSQRIFGGPGFSPQSDVAFVRAFERRMLAAKARVVLGGIASMDMFYDVDKEILPKLKKFGVLAVEMEAATITTLAASRGLRAACVLSVSDTIYDGVRADEGEIQAGFSRAVEHAFLAGLEVI